MPWLSPASKKPTIPASRLGELLRALPDRHMHLVGQMQPFAAAVFLTKDTGLIREMAPTFDPVMQTARSQTQLIADRRADLAGAHRVFHAFGLDAWNTGRLADIRRTRLNFDGIDFEVENQTLGVKADNVTFVLSSIAHVRASAALPDVWHSPWLERDADPVRLVTTLAIPGYFLRFETGPSIEAMLEDSLAKAIDLRDSSSIILSDESHDALPKSA